jgi:DNA-binding XRE family transcriptional regulator
MISAAQLRAARGLLDWSRSDLSKASKVSQETIKNIEHGVFRPQETTEVALIRAFAAQGVEFTENDGVRKPINTLVNYEGKEAFKKYADDIYFALLQNPKDRSICILGNNDEKFVEALGNYADLHIQRMNKLEGLKFRALMAVEEKIFVADYIEYRRLPKLTAVIPFSVYSDCFDFIIYGEGKAFPKVVAIKSQTVADAYRAQFDAMWKQSTPIKTKLE